MKQNIFIVILVLLTIALCVGIYRDWAYKSEYVVLASPRGLCVGVDEIRRGDLVQKHTCREIMLKISTDEWGRLERVFVSPYLKGYSEQELSGSPK